MNYLGIDFGKSKIGLATSKAGVAIPFRVASNIDEVKQVIKEEAIDEIVVGYPLSLSGEVGAQAKEVDEFIKQLESINKPVHKQDERFSSRSAVGKREDDASAATLILQTYLEKVSK